MSEKAVGAGGRDAGPGRPPDRPTGKLRSRSFARAVAGRAVAVARPLCLRASYALLRGGRR